MTETTETPDTAPEELAELGSDTSDPGYKAAYSKAISGATGWLRSTYRGEYHEEIQRLMLEAGYDWRPRPTADQRAAEQILRLAADHHLDLSELAGLAEAHREQFEALANQAPAKPAARRARARK